ncbi:transposase [Geobacillus stearothermophilus]|uniref:transposase n=1 Tax=Anoxybacillaceae TaxID=3120669 RepID=UPI000EF589C2|nr:transposase [Geobacillus stearothermophilus]
MELERKTKTSSYIWTSCDGFFIGALNAVNGEFLCMKAAKCNAQSFQQFLEYVLLQYPKKHIVMILDNARIHHALILKPFLEKHQKQLTLLFLPPYSPNLNLCERI